MTPGETARLNSRQVEVNSWWTVQGGAAEFVRLLAFSLGSLTTVGTADLVPRAGWIRLIVAIESLRGFSLVTASITWIVLIFPALSRTRTLARRVAILIRAQDSSAVRAISPHSTNLLSDLALEVIRTRVDLVLYPLIYFFYVNPKQAPLAISLTALSNLAAEAGTIQAADQMRLSSAMLEAALDDLAKVIARRLPGVNQNDPQAVFDAFARDHLAGT